jgi:hypothetical protein
MAKRRETVQVKFAHGEGGGNKRRRSPWSSPFVVLGLCTLLVTAGAACVTAYFQVHDHFFAPHADPRYAMGMKKLDALKAKIGEASDWVEAHRANGEDVTQQVQNISIANGEREIAGTNIAHGDYSAADQYIDDANRILDRIIVDPIVYDRIPSPGAILAAAPSLVSLNYHIHPGANISTLRLLVDGIPATLGSGTGIMLTGIPSLPIESGIHDVRLVLTDRTGWEVSSEWQFEVQQRDTSDSSAPSPGCPEDPSACR